MFLEPNQTQYDLKFSFLGFPVRVHPAFFILPLLLGGGIAQSMDNLGVGLILVSIVFFLAVLIHEVGHGLAFRRYGIGSHLVLYWIGGLAIPNQSGYGKPALNANRKMFISVAGPLAGFALAAALALLGLALGGDVAWNPFPWSIPYVRFQESSMFAGSQAVYLFINAGILINVFLSIFNLMPVYPLDGGQIAREFMHKVDPQHGFQNSIFLSLATCALIIIFALSIKANFLALMFGFLAFSNFQLLQQSRGPRW